MKEKNNIDNLFKESISAYKVEPSGQVWQNVESGFFGKKGFAFYKWYYVSAAILLFLLSAGGIWYFNKNNFAEESIINKLANQDDGVLQSSTVNKQSIDEIENDQSTSKSEDNQVNMVIESFDVSDEEFIASQGNINDLKPKTEIGNQDQADNSSLPLLSQNDPAINFYSKETGNFKSNFDESAELTGTFYLDARSISLDNSQEPYMIDPKKVTGMQKYLEKQRKSHLYTGASFTSGMVYYPSTKDQFTWSADLTFGLTAGKFYFETGVSYQDMKERGIYAIELKSYDSVGYYNDVESFEINPQNPEEIIYNTKEVTVYDSLNHYTHTTPYFKYKYINVPLSVGFKFFNKDKFTAAVFTGVSLSMLIEKDIPDSEYYDPEYTVVRIRNMTPERVDWNMIWMVSVRLNYKFYKSLSISAEPVFTKYLNSIYNTEKGYSNVKPYTMNLRVGLYYGF